MIMLLEAKLKNTSWSVYTLSVCWRGNYPASELELQATSQTALGL